MSRSMPSIAKVQIMMHKMHIDKKPRASSQSITTMVFENQLLDRSPDHQCHQRKQNDRARLFYQLRQKKKQRKRLQHGLLPASRHQHQNHDQHLHFHQRYDQQLHFHQRYDQHQNLQQMSINNYEQNQQKKRVSAIVGSSIARNISVKQIESERDEVRLRFKSGSDCADALAWLKSTEGQIFMRNVECLFFVIGTNDLHHVGAVLTVQRIDHTVAAVRCLYPRIKIVWQLLQQRSRKTLLLSEGEAVMNEIARCNILLLELAVIRNFDTIQPGIPIRYMYDGLHPSNYGVEMMEATIRSHLRNNHMAHSSAYSNNSHCYQSGTYPGPLMSINF